MKDLGQKLGKLSLAILENFVEGVLGKKFVEELRAPTDQSLAIDFALENSEQRFASEFPDKVFAAKMFAEVSGQNLGLILDAIEKFYDHPTDPNFRSILIQIIAESFPEIDAAHVESAVDLYIEILTEEFALVDEKFRENVRGLSDLRMLNILRRVEILLSQKELPKIEHRSFPKGNRFPFLPNKAFTNRKPEIELLESVLLVENTHPLTPRIAMITGMRGVGKTQLAVEFCYRYGGRFDGIHWIDASQSIDSEIAACGQEMGLPNLPDETSERVAYTLRAWQDNPNRLVILDNIDEPKLIREWLPKLNSLKILITSHHVNWRPDLGLDARELDILSRSDSISLLRKLTPSPRLNHLTDEELSKVADYLWDLPLALDLAGRYLDDKPDLTPDEYLDRLNKTETNPLQHTSLLNWVSDDESPTLHSTSLISTFLLSWEQLDKNADALARAFFISAGYLAPNVPISHNIFYTIATEVNSEGSAMDEDIEDIADKSISRLQNLGLIRHAQSSHSLIHPLLARFAQKQAEDSRPLNILTQKMLLLSGDALATRLPSEFGNLRQHMESLTKFVQNIELISASALWNNLGKYYQLVAEYTLAEYAFGKAFEAAEENSEQRARSINNLGSVLQTLGQIDIARDHFMQALSIWVDAFGDDHPGSTEFLINLGSAQRGMGDYEAARQNVERALKIDREKYTIFNDYVSRDLNGLGEILRLQGDLEEAKQLFEEALKIDESLENDLDVARDLNSLGEILSLGDHDGAKSSFERAIEIYEKWFGKEHPEIARCLKNVGNVLKAENDKEGANYVYKRAAIIYEKTFPAGHHYIQELKGLMESL